MSDDYILPAEFAALVAFLFAPPLLIAIAAQTAIYRARGVFARRRTLAAVIGYVFTILGSLVCGAVIHQLAPRSFNPVLRVRDIAVGSLSFPVMPLTFFAVAFIAPVVAWLVVRRASKA